MARMIFLAAGYNAAISFKKYAHPFFCQGLSSFFLRHIGWFHERWNLNRQVPLPCLQAGGGSIFQTLLEVHYSLW